MPSQTPMLQRRVRAHKQRLPHKMFGKTCKISFLAVFNAHRQRRLHRWSAIAKKAESYQCHYRVFGKK